MPTETQIKQAVKLWKAGAPDNLQNVVTAKPAHDVGDYVKAGLIIYLAGKYLDTVTGAVVSLLAVREALDGVLDIQNAAMRDITQQLIDDKITIDEWEAEMKHEIILTQTDAMLSAHGGEANMSADDWALLDQRINDQLSRLADFAGQIKNGEIPLDGRLLSRAGLYALAGVATFEAVRTIVQTGQGWTQERRFLEPDAAHCEGCVDQAKKGWQPIGTLEPIGSQECRVNCRCTKKYRRMSALGSWIESEEE